MPTYMECMTRIIVPLWGFLCIRDVGLVIKRLQSKPMLPNLDKTT